MMHRYGKMYHRILESKIDLRVKYIHQQINVHAKKSYLFKMYKKRDRSFFIRKVAHNYSTQLARVRTYMYIHIIGPW